MPDRYRLRLVDPLTQLLRNLHPGLERKIRAGIDVIREDPRAGKELREDLSGLRSFRVGRLRIIYRIAPRRVIEVIAVGARRVVYEETFWLLRRERGAPR